MRYELDDNRFLIGNNCTVCFLYRDLLQTRYETPFVWNHCTYDNLIWLSRFWNDIEWEAQDFTPIYMQGDEMRKRSGITLPSLTNNDVWRVLRLFAKNGEEFLTCFPHFGCFGQSSEQMWRRARRMLKAIDEGKKPLFILAKEYPIEGYTRSQLEAVEEDESIVLCDFPHGHRFLPKWTATNVALPNLIERGYVKAVEE